MKVIKNINNNVSLCRDSKGREIIAFGKGIGFIKAPYDIPLNKIERTFYNITGVDYGAIKDIDETVMKAAIRIIDTVEEKLNVVLISTATLALADHISFAIQRLKKGVNLSLQIQEDIKHIYPLEMKEAYESLKIIEEETGVKLARGEAGTIALHFINSQIDMKDNIEVDCETILQKSVNIIEKEFDIILNKESFNYSRFATHIDYLLRRALKNKQIESENSNIYKTLIVEFPQTYSCVVKLSELFEKDLNIELSDEEELYLILHINRLYAREVGL